MKPNNKQACFAEVVESTLQGWTAQSWQWNVFPYFGSLVITQDSKRTIFGIVHAMQTGSMEQGRLPFPYQKTEAELLKEQPQIFAFLRTIFSCASIGFIEQSETTISYYTAPEPPKIHSFVQYASPEQERLFFSSSEYIYLLYNTPGIQNIDELLLSIIKQRKKQNYKKEDLLNLIDAYTQLVGNDYRRVSLFLKRV